LAASSQPNAAVVLAASSQPNAAAGFAVSSQHHATGLVGGLVVLSPRVLIKQVQSVAGQAYHSVTRTLLEHPQDGNMDASETQQEPARRAKNCCGGCAAMLNVVRLKSEHPTGRCPVHKDDYKHWKAQKCQQYGIRDPSKLEVAKIIKWKESEGVTLEYSAGAKA